MMHMPVATLATEAESDDAIEEGEVDGGRDRVNRQSATTQPPTAP